MKHFREFQTINIKKNILFLLYNVYKIVDKE